MILIKLRLTTRCKNASIASARLALFGQQAAIDESKHLRETEKRLSAILETCPFAVAVTTRSEGRILYANPRFRRIFDLDPNDLSVARATEFWADPKDRLEFSRRYERDGRVSGDEIRLKRRTGEEYWAFAAWEPIPLFGDDAIISWIYDVSHIKKSNEQLVKATAAAEKANQAKSEFLASMSHEFRTPLNAILGFAQLLEFTPSSPLNPMQQSAVDNIKKGGEHLLALIRQVLDLSKIEAGNLELETKPTNIEGLLEDCAVIGTTMADKHGIKFIDKTAGKSLPLAQIDETALKQVVLNLISNAIKYNRPDGSVTLEASPLDTDNLRITVSDTGPGIAEDHAGEIFEPFNRLGREASNIEGSGIGLTIAKQLMEQMQGDIGYESTPGSGSTFWVDVPVCMTYPPVFKGLKNEDER